MLAADAGMATAATTVIAVLPSAIWPSQDSPEWIFLLFWYALAAARVMVGFVFLWAFLDKTLGLGFATQHGKAWLDGVSPTTGFLKFGVNEKSPLFDFFQSLAGNPLVDWLFMLGLLGIGLALMLGIGLRVAAVAGTTLLMMMWAAEVPLENNPLVDDLPEFPGPQHRHRCRLRQPGCRADRQCCPR